MTEYLSLEDLQYLISRVLSRSPDSVVRDWGLLASALHRPQSTVFGTSAYPDVHSKAAALLHSLARNHPLLDGNKRLAWLATRLFYVRNELDLRASDPQSADTLVREVAIGKYEVEQLAKLLSTWIVNLAE